MVKIYTQEKVIRLLHGVRQEYEKLIRAQQNRIVELTEENRRMAQALSQNGHGGFSDVQGGELDMNKILYPDEGLDLENLCRELGLMDDEQAEQGS